MKYFLVIFLSIISFENYAQTNQKSNIENIKKHLSVITKTEKPRNFKNLETLNFVANYIKQELNKVCDSVEFQNFNVAENEYKNVIGSIGLEHQQRIIFGAHYDVCGDSDGADDNASGVVGLLELARLLSKEKLNYRIDFVAYSLE
ncbi:M28 family peptidase [Polaribacter sp. Hel_I_88]|uniref:M28 family peptidase n=1 Tax=Polaribacter sp. Hel_I_88 TaxID=1250006 RepID=UPI00068E0EB2|nr:M28 family peptidase [Polaribacter sp. Hel_I_88]